MAFLAFSGASRHRSPSSRTVVRTCLATALGACSLWAQATTHYIHYSSVTDALSGSHTRYPHRTGPDSSLTPVRTSFLETNTGTADISGSIPPTFSTLTGQTYALVSLTVNGNAYNYSAGGPALPATVAVPSTTDIYVVAFYAPVCSTPGGCSGGAPTPGVTIDEFDEVSGRLYNDLFVAVNPASLSTQANDDGWVPTQDGAATITAQSTIAGKDPSTGAAQNLSFDHWQLFIATAGVTAHDAVLSAPQGSTANALALYRACPSGSWWNTTSSSCKTPQPVACTPVGPGVPKCPAGEGAFTVSGYLGLACYHGCAPLCKPGTKARVLPSGLPSCAG